MDRGAWWAAVYGIAKSRARLSDKNLFTYLLAYLGKWGFPGVSDSKESSCNAEDPGSICGLVGCLGEGNRCPLQYSCLENPMDRGNW